MHNNPAIIKKTNQVWNTFNLETGNPIIDIQHTWLIGMVFQVEEISKIGNVDTKRLQFIDCIENLTNYIINHFCVEEIYIHCCKCEMMSKTHKKQHETLTNEFIIEKTKIDNKLNTLEIHKVIDIFSKFLREGWLYRHIAIEDKASISLLCSQKSKCKNLGTESCHGLDSKKETMDRWLNIIKEKKTMIITKDERTFYEEVCEL